MDFYTTAIIQGMGYAAMGLGIFISLKIFNIPDITTDGSYTLGGALTAIMLIHNIHPLVVLPAAILAGAAAGIATGLIHTRLKINPLLSGILVMTALFSINLEIMGRSNIPLIEAGNIFMDFSLSDSTYFNQLLIMSLILLMLVFFLRWLLKTDFGIAMRATGNSEQMVTASGVNTRTMKIIGLAMANACTALSGYLMVQYQGFSDINMGIGIVISGLGSVMISESFLRFSKTKKIALQLMLVISGSIVFRIILAAALSWGLNPNYLKLVTALIVLAVVSIPVIRKKNKVAVS
jgi:putative tryptophan/tyrosine transport system permease protein